MDRLDDLEIDLIELTVGCAEQCVHCSESPETGVVHADASVLLRAVRWLAEYEERTGIGLFANYWYPFPASDPFSNPGLFEICDSIWNSRGLKSYLLSLGWGRAGSLTAKKICERPQSLFRMCMTFSNFSALARLNPDKHIERLARCLLDLQPLWDSVDRDGSPIVLISPQYVEVEKGTRQPEFFGEIATTRLTESVCSSAGVDLERWRREGRVFPRPVIGLGRARTVLGVEVEREIPVSAEYPIPPISRFPERPFSGLITLNGGLAMHPGERGRLGRTRDSWRQVSKTEMDVMAERASMEISWGGFAVAI